MANPPKSNLYMDGVYEKRCREFTAAAATDAAEAVCVYAAYGLIY